jgi:hypothetical protein
MNVSEILVTVGLPVAGSVAIACITLHLRTKHRRRRLFGALLSEVEWNRSLAKHLKDDSLTNLKRHTSLHTVAYQNLQSEGELLGLPEHIRQNLMYTYEMINTHNWEMEQGKITPPYGVYFVQRNNEILEKLTFLQEELPKVVKYLKRERK